MAVRTFASRTRRASQSKETRNARARAAPRSGCYRRARVAAAASENDLPLGAQPPPTSPPQRPGCRQETSPRAVALRPTTAFDAHGLKTQPRGVSPGGKDWGRRAKLIFKRAKMHVLFLLFVSLLPCAAPPLPHLHEMIPTTFHHNVLHCPVRRTMSDRIYGTVRVRVLECPP